MASSTAPEVRPGYAVWAGKVTHRAFPLAIAVGVFTALWVLAASATDPSVLPAPWVVIGEMQQNWSSLRAETAYTVQGVVFGFALAVAIAIPLAVASLYVPFFDRTIYPLLVMSQIVPKVALAPLFVVWFGYGLTTILAMSCLIAFFPILVDTLFGLRVARPSHLALFRSMHASRLQTLRKLLFPGAVPNIFVGLKLGAIFAVIGALVGEFVGSDHGLGHLIKLSQGNLDTPAMMATIAWVTILGLVMYSTVQLLEKWTLSRPIRRRDALLSKQQPDPVAEARSAS